jgi:hypothetical protein
MTNKIVRGNSVEMQATDNNKEGGVVVNGSGGTDTSQLIMVE